MRTQKAFKNMIYNGLFFVLVSIITFFTKKMFISSLGNNTNGLNSLFSSIMSFLNLAELGVGGSVIYALYKPIQEKNYSLIKGIISFYKKMYTYSGVAVILLGFAVTPFINIFIKDQMDISKVQVYFLIYLLNTSLSYFFTYKLPILYVNQENYVISKYDSSIKVIKNIVQIGILYIFRSYVIFLVIETLFNITYYFIINKVINKRYKVIFDATGSIDIATKKDLFKNIKALSLHKIGGFVVFGTDSMLMSYFANLNILGLYNNYLMVITFFNSLIAKLFEGLVASIGNLIVSTNNEKTKDVFNKVYFFNFCLVSFCLVCIYNTINKFVIIWLGKDFILDRNIVTLMLINFYILNMRPSIDRFKEAAGIYHNDRFFPLIEAAINFVACIILGRYLGIAGIILGTIISSLTVIFWIRPILVYKLVFKSNALEYYINYAKYLFISLAMLFSSNYITSFINLKSNFLTFVVTGIFSAIYVNLIFIILFRKTDEYSYFKNFILNKIGISSKRK
ncbi:lipopolysaccharide biosynthesis protein [Clostridium paridis]|uniref:Oligosaccharide flippase family protein n=1 Tax=Clostridium paridis TaxID=2803863 RepID=A0A937K3Q2_9CLOT|nr:hypothetical protein [Clostridium paridis]MBL4932621.1 hypothetical protein [Clostridium paridis]